MKVILFSVPLLKTKPLPFLIGVGLILGLSLVMGGIGISQWVDRQNQQKLLGKIEQLRIDKRYQACVEKVKTVRTDSSIAETASKLGKDCENRLLIEQWKLELLDVTFCTGSLVTIVIDDQEYCVNPSDWLKAGKYRYNRQADQLEPIEFGL